MATPTPKTNPATTTDPTVIGLRLTDASQPGIGGSEATDSVITEVRRVKAELMKRYDYDLAAMFRDARERQDKSERTVVTKTASA